MLGRFKDLSVVARLRGLVQHDVEHSLKPLRKELRQLSRQVSVLEAALRETAERAARGDRYAAQVKWTLQLDAAQRELLPALAATLDEPRVAAHVGQAVAGATLHDDPFEHIIVDRLLPDDVYELLLRALPPVEFFTDRDPVKQDLPLPMQFGPALQTRVWEFVSEVVAKQAIRPAVMEKFHGPLQHHYDRIFGPQARADANALPQSTSGGRLMLRRPGYHLDPHRDPKRSLVTCLLYLARPGDDESYGTQIFRVVDDAEAHYKQTYYPEREGHRCELVHLVPFRPNSMLAFLNSRGAHGADIPAAAPRGIERYSYQFYIAPDNAALAALLKSLPAERRAMWKSVETVY